MNLNRPNLQGLVAPTGASKAGLMGGGEMGAGGSSGVDAALESHRRAMAAQDKYNLDVQNAVKPLVTPVVWTPLTPINSWVNYGGSNTTPAWCWDPFHWRVWLKGTIKSGTVSSSVALFSNLVPAPAHLFDTGVGTNTGIGELIVRLNGTIVLASGGNGFLLLDGLSYDPLA